MNAQQIANEAKRTGKVWLGGEMDFPANEGPKVAFDRAVMISEACGYVTQWLGYDHSAFKVTGGSIPGYAVLDWFDPNAKELVKVEIWSASAEYLK